MWLLPTVYTSCSDVRRTPESRNTVCRKSSQSICKQVRKLGVYWMVRCSVRKKMEAYHCHVETFRRFHVHYAVTRRKFLSSISDRTLRAVTQCTWLPNSYYDCSTFHYNSVRRVTTVKQTASQRLRIRWNQQCHCRVTNIRQLDCILNHLHQPVGVFGFPRSGIY
jgi:hypothetical protein